MNFFQTFSNKNCHRQYPKKMYVTIKHHQCFYHKKIMMNIYWTKSQLSLDIIITKTKRNDAAIFFLVENFEFFSKQ